MNMKGFTLIETMVAITILTLAVAGPLVTANRAIVASQISRSQLTANYLAQEAIEYVRAVRDDAYLNAYYSGGTSDTAWNAFRATISQCSGSYKCTYDPTRNDGVGSGLSLELCQGASCRPLYLTNSVYTEQNSGTPTEFTRTIQVTNVSNTDELVESTVSWYFHNTLHSIVVTDHLTPWQ